MWLFISLLLIFVVSFIVLILTIPCGGGGRLSDKKYMEDNCDCHKLY